MSKVNKHQKQTQHVKEYYRTQIEMCMREIVKIKQACIEANLIHTK